MGGSQCPEPEDQDCENDQLLVDPELVQDLVDPIKVFGAWWDSSKSTQKSCLMSLQGLSMIFEWFWEFGGVPSQLKSG